MACKPFSFQVCQHDEPPDSGSGWTNNDTAMGGGDTLTVRSRFLVTRIGDDCTGQFEWYYRWEGGDWVYIGVAKNVEPGFSKWYYVDFVPAGLGGTYDIRSKLIYDGYDYYSTSFEVEVAGQTPIPTTTEAGSDLEETAGARTLTQDAEASALTQTAGAPGRSVTAEVSTLSETAGVSALSQDATGEGRTQTAGAPARTQESEGRDREQAAGGKPRTETAEMLSELTETAGAV